MKKINAIIRASRLQAVIKELQTIPGLTGVTMSTVRGYGCHTWTKSEEIPPLFKNSRTIKAEAHTKIEIICADHVVEKAVSAIETAAKTGRPGDGKITVFPIDDVIRIQTGARGEQAIQQQGIIRDHD